MTLVKICGKCRKPIEGKRHSGRCECGANLIEHMTEVEENDHGTELPPLIAPQPKPLEATLTFLTNCGLHIQAHNGDIIGREAVGAQLQPLDEWSNYLDQFSTVSRKHIKVFTKNGEWWLKNLSDDQPTSSTWLNDQSIPQNEERKLEMSHILKLGYEFGSHTKRLLTVMP